MKTLVRFEETIDNALFDKTGWSDHDKLTVGVHGRYTFNSTPVEGLIQIIQQEDDDAEADDFRDMMGPTVITTAAGARLLAAVLLKAADVADLAS
ncbi:hypothetical protein [Sphingomonas sp. TREG-RG-20F-R18-01]|uniref:hypothetical protein n=1 Tax=Sphingomonas sp. TREG-RG-20F-R18-01 TaxID=2914982 RepID=UPI001F578826|nr:hypothetical protein [Sphingomonas sp. TREG-RG-20F-R18-01]